MASWLTDINDRSKWESEPTAQVARTVACTALFPLCVGYDLAVRAGELAETGAQRAGAALEGVEGVARGGTAGLFDGLTNLVDSTTQPLDRAAAIAQWVAIGLIAITVLAALIFVWRLVG